MRFLHNNVRGFFEENKLSIIFVCLFRIIIRYASCKAIVNETDTAKNAFRHEPFPSFERIIWKLLRLQKQIVRNPEHRIRISIIAQKIIMQIQKITNSSSKATSPFLDGIQKVHFLLFIVPPEKCL